MSAQLNLISNLDESDPCEGRTYQHTSGARVRVGTVSFHGVFVYSISSREKRVPKLHWSVNEFLSEFVRVEK